MTSGGRKLVLEIIPPGGVDGLLPMLGQRGHFTEAAEDSRVALLDWTLLEQLFVVEPRIMRTLFELIASRLERREEQLESMMIRDPTQRLARQLCALAGAVGEPEGDRAVTMPRSITHQSLADMLGIRRETVTLHLHHLAELGAVDIHGRQLIVRPRELEIVASRSED
jgi:CRP-like cAMP-binding protein